MPANRGQNRNNQSFHEFGRGNSRNVFIDHAPTDVFVIEETTSTLDLSEMRLRYTGSNRSEISIQVSASSGTLTGENSHGVLVQGSGTGTLILTGSVKELNDFINDTTAITYTGGDNISGENAASITLEHESNSGTVQVGVINVVIEDTPDEIIGTENADELSGTNNGDTIIGLGGNDTIKGGAGADTMYGGAGADWLSYNGSDGAVTIDLNVDADGFHFTSGGHADGDRASGFENIYGSDFDDVLIGNSAGNYLLGRGGVDVIDGGAGDDTIRGGADADTMYGGAGIDILQYENSADGVVVDLHLGVDGNHQLSGGDAEGDVANGFENVHGSSFADHITGDENRNFLYGFEGDDMINGGAGNDVIRGGVGADTLDGGTGVDVLQYTDAQSGIEIDLSTGMGTVGDAAGDIVSNFEHVYASDFDDAVTGDAGRNILFGYEGNDTLNSGAGADTIMGGAGADVMDGGASYDWLRYNGSNTGVIVDLRADADGYQSASGGHATGDVISNFENVYGSSHDDVIGTNETYNTMYGGAGSDTFIINGGDLGARNLDRILDFTSGEDQIHLNSDAFVGLDEVQLIINTTGLAEGADAQLIYNSDTGYLYYDADGAGGEDPLGVLRLTGAPDINGDDFQIV